MNLDPVDIHFDARSPWRTLANLYRPERRRVWLAAVCFLAKATPVWALPVLTANIVDVLARPGLDAVPRLWVNGLVGFAVISQNVLTHLLYVRFLSAAVRTVEVRLRSALVRRLQMLSLGYLDRQNVAVLQAKLLRDVESMEQMVRQLFDIGLFAVATLAVTMAVTAFRSPVFLPVFAAVIPLIWVSRRVIEERLQRRNEALRRALEGMSASVLGMLAMIPVTRAHAAEDEEISRAENRFEAVSRAAYSLDRAAGFLGGAAWVLLMLVNFGGLVAAAWLAQRGVIRLTPGDLVLLVGYFGAVMTAVLQLNGLLPVVTRGIDAIRSIEEVLECPDIEVNRGKRPIQRVRGRFDFEGVGFTYPGGDPAAPALADITASVLPGERVALAGPSGSGKSTLACLITGFHRPTSGRLLIDGEDITAIDLRTYRRQLAVVSQQTILFHGTLRENIAYGAREVDAARLRAAVEAANVDEFVRGLPRGLDTVIGPGGLQLSGGQRQRVAIARALLRDPHVILLDEATSALDPAGEEVVLQALDRLSAGRTTFVIAHRPALLLRADRVIVLERGRILEQGTPAELAGRPSGFLARALLAPVLT